LGFVLVPSRERHMCGVRRIRTLERYFDTHRNRKAVPSPRRVTTTREARANPYLRTSSRYIPCCDAKRRSTFVGSGVGSRGDRMPFLFECESAITVLDDHGSVRRFEFMPDEGNVFEPDLYLAHGDQVVVDDHIAVRISVNLPAGLVGARYETVLNIDTFGDESEGQGTQDERSALVESIRKRHFSLL